jgi:hypothetical protein
MDTTTKPEPGYGAVYAAALYPELVAIGRKHGYALAVHGSLRRDFDLVAVPWVDEASEPETLIAEITATFAIDVLRPPADKPHGRRAWSIVIGHGHCAIDLSFMPRLNG